MSSEQTNEHTQNNHTLPLTQSTAHLKHPSFALNKTEEGTVLTAVFAAPLEEEIEALLLVHAGSGASLTVPKTESEAGARFEVSDADLFSLSANTQTTLACAWVLSSGSEEETEDEAPEPSHLPVSLTAFEEVSLPSPAPFSFNDETAQFFVKGSDLNLMVFFNQSVSRAHLIPYSEVSGIEQSEQDLIVTGSFTTRLFQVSKLEASIESEDEKMYALRTASFELRQTNAQTHTYTYDYRIQLRCSRLARQLFMEQLGDRFFSLYLLVHLVDTDAPLSLVIENPSDPVRASTSSESVHTFGRMAYVFTHRFDASGFLQLCAVLYDRDVLTYARERSSTIWLTRPFHSKEAIWLIGADTPYRTSFDSLDFFRYIREQLPEQEVYYVLDPSSSDWETAKTAAGDRLLAYKSEEYVWKLLVSSLLITGGPAHHFYPFGNAGWDKYVRAKKVILPDHLLGMSDERWTFNQQTIPWKTDLLVTSSKAERRFAIDSLGFPDDAIALTGLPHHARLLEKSNRRPEENVLMVLPHTRKPKWKSRYEQLPDPFLALAKNDAFKLFLRSADLTPSIVLPRHQEEEAAAFAEEGWTVLHEEEQDLLELFLNTRLLLTDYHPSALDFALLERPIFFYHPYPSESERMDYSEDTISSIRSYHNELPGEIAEREDDLIYLLEQCHDHELEMSRKNRKKADALLENRDRQANERILDAIRNS